MREKDRELSRRRHRREQALKDRKRQAVEAAKKAPAKKK